MFGNNIKMNNHDKKTLREFLGVDRISTAKKQLGIENYSNERAYNILNELYEADLQSKAINNVVQRNQVRNILTQTILDRQERRVDKTALDGAVRIREYTPVKPILHYTNIDGTNLNSQHRKVYNIIKNNFIDYTRPQNIVLYLTFLVELQPIYDEVTGRYEPNFFYQIKKIGERNFDPLNPSEFFSNKLLEKIGRTQPSTKSGVVSVNITKIHIKSTLLNVQGGCAGRDCKYGKQIKLKNGQIVLFNPRGSVESMDCLFNCLGVKGSTIRKELAIEKKTKININQLQSVADYVKKHMIVYDAQMRKITEVGNKYDELVELVLIQEHYTKIIKKQKKCKDCGTVYYDKHECNKSKVRFYKFRNKERIVKKRTRIIKKEPLDYSNTIYFDFETFVPKDKKSFEVYACGYFNTETQQADRFYGKNALTQFVKYMCSQKGKTFIAHNGSRFDNYFLITELIKTGNTPKDIILNNGALMSFKFGENNKMLDSINFLMCPLGKAGKSFGLDPKFWKSDFNHSKIKSWEDTQTHKNEVVDYLDLDVLCLKYAWEKFSDKMFDAFKVHTQDFITTSSMAYAIWTNSMDETIYLPDEEELEFVRKSIYGANVYPTQKHYKSTQHDDLMSGKIKYDELTDYLKIMDVVSLYPTSMTNIYPVGKSKWTTEYNSCIMGIWEIDFEPPKDIFTSQLPRKVNGGIVHSLESGSGVYNSIDIKRAVDAGYKITKVHKGLIWEAEATPFRDYVLNGFELKNKAREEGDAVMYAISKLLLNGLYGKTLQRPIYNKVTIASTHNDALDFINNHDEIEDISILNENNVLYCGSIKPEEYNDAITKPSQLGSFVLGYSRTIMYNIQKKIDPTLKKPSFFYTDTDCFHIHAKDLNILNDIMGDDLGQINSDLDNEGKIIEGIYLAPKQYSVSYVDNKENISGKFKCKGISNKYLKPEMYSNALNKKSTQVVMKDSFKKIHYKQNSNQLQYDKFSIHLEDIQRTFHKTEWEGRMWMGNVSFPIGHELPIQQMLLDKNIPPEISKLIIAKM